MIVTLDGEHLGGSFSDCATLQSLIDQVRQAQLGDRLVVTVTVDGQVLLEEQLSDHLQGSLDGIQRVDLTSADRRQTVIDSLREVAEHLGQASGEQAGVAEQLHAGKVPAAINRFGDFLQVWQVCQRAIVECSGLLGQDLTAMKCGGRAVREHLDGLADGLRELRDAFEAHDTVLLADLARYELPDVCRSWQGILTEMASNVAAQAATPTS